MRILSLTRSALYYLLVYPVYRHSFKSFGRRSRIYSPLQIDGRQNISIGKRVIVQHHSWLAALPLTGAGTCRLMIGEGSILGHFNHIYATRSVVIGKHVLTADKVYISDNLHGYEDIDIPVMHQAVRQCPDVEIGDGSWIGENVCIIGARIGRHCVIGANAVVNRDIPDYCVAGGIPAVILKRYDHESGKWRKTDTKGEFIL